MKSKRKYKKALKRIRSSGAERRENEADSTLPRSMGLGQCGEALQVRPVGPGCETQAVEKGLLTPGEHRMEELSPDGLSTRSG